MTSSAPDRGHAVYSISVAADLVGIGVQTLRLYERRGLIEPQRTDGGTRRYSQAEVDRSRRITELLADGLNLAGIAVVLDLQDDNARMRAELHRHHPTPAERSRNRQPRRRPE
jgi:MerR family transcriptional regulator, heat shock protein HspR